MNPMSFKLTMPENMDEMLLDLDHRRGGLIMALTRDNDVYLKQLNEAFSQGVNLGLIGLPTIQCAMVDVTRLPVDFPHPSVHIPYVSEADNETKTKLLVAQAQNADGWIFSLTSRYFESFFVSAEERIAVREKLRVAAPIATIVQNFHNGDLSTLPNVIFCKICGFNISPCGASNQAWRKCLTCNQYSHEICVSLTRRQKKFNCCIVAAGTSNDPPRDIYVISG